MLPKREDKWGAIGKRLAALLTAGPLDRKKDEEVLFNKGARSGQATITQQQLPQRRPSGVEVKSGKRMREKRRIAWKGQQKLREVERGLG